MAHRKEEESQVKHIEFEIEMAEGLKWLDQHPGVDELFSKLRKIFTQLYENGASLVGFDVGHMIGDGSPLLLVISYNDSDESKVLKTILTSDLRHYIELSFHKDNKSGQQFIWLAI